MPHWRETPFVDSKPLVIQSDCPDLSRKAIMRTCLAAYVLACVLGTLLVGAPDVSGSWTVEFRRDTSQPPDRDTCVFRLSGERLTGHCGDVARWSIRGRLENRTLTWEFKSGSSQEISATFRGELNEAATMVSGTWTFVDSSDGSSGSGIFEAKKR